MEIQQTYRMLKYQEALYKKELDIKKKELQEISTEKQNITIKKIMHNNVKMERSKADICLQLFRER